MVVDNNGRTVALGERGELLTRGYATMLGYWADQHRTDEAITDDRWYRTGYAACYKLQLHMNIKINTTCYTEPIIYNLILYAAHVIPNRIIN